MSEDLRKFRSLVNERGDGLRKLAFEQLRRSDEPTERFVVGKRKAKLSIIVDPLPSGGILVVVQGFLRKRFLPMVWDVALDGFYKYPDETMSPMTREDMWAYD